MIIDDIIHKFEAYEITRNDIVILDRSNETKTSLHFILQKIHFQNVKSLKFLHDVVFKSLFDNVDFLDGVIYGIRPFRMPLCTKYGKDRHLSIVSNHTFKDALVTYISEDSVLLQMKEDIKKTVVQPIRVLPSNEQCGLEQCFVKNIAMFTEHANDYSTWVSVGIKLYRAGCSLETFKKFSSLSSKYDENTCERKWESFKHYEKDSNCLLTFMEFVGVDIAIGDTSAFEDCVFNKDRFHKNMLVFPAIGSPNIHQMYVDFVIEYINRFHCMVTFTKPDFFF